MKIRVLCENKKKGKKAIPYNKKKFYDLVSSLALYFLAS